VGGALPDAKGLLSDACDSTVQRHLKILQQQLSRTALIEMVEALKLRLPTNVIDGDKHVA
jgi:hypothetical protein